MLRFFVSPETLETDDVRLSEEIVHHLRTVLRREAGEIIQLLDGTGGICRCRVETLGKKGGLALILERGRMEDTAFPIHLFQALPKGDKIDLVLQKGTELGVSSFTVVLAGRSVPVLSAEREDKRQQRWQRIVQEAARQCQRPVLPRLGPALPLAEALVACTEELKLMLWEDESLPLVEALPEGRPGSAAVLVGPEGGFSAEEAAAARKAGFIPVRCGPRILRSETAGFAIASVLQYLYGDLGAGSR